MWPQYHRDGGLADGMAQRLEATALARVVMERWRRDYRHQRPELRRRSDNQISTDQIGGGDDD